MTPVDKDNFEDADLVRRLASLPQPEPSAELDAAIFAHIQKDLAAGPAAANDPAVEAPRPKPKHRYRAPLAFAASLAGIAILFPVWRSYQHQELQPLEVRIVPEELPAAMPAPMIGDEEAAAPAEKKRESAIVAAKPAPAIPQMDMPLPAAEPAESVAPPPPPPPPAPAPAPAAAPPAPKMEVDELDSPRKAAARSLEAESPKEWLQSIERLLDAGDTGSATAQWKRFRKAHPDYPVPDTLAGRLKALE
ncbi:hypothetical protein SAMN05518865_105274 [Duganella sp. CF458]|uniref:hypothetical protein n=1 Tax=Duganella sp. CF458 TaxID=1884368 RepID=UPI0008F3BB1F|nr:hypothetical protein [Duganella sp. CF458]SFF87142.1 hypothetical protein SAMN05518865_105274 [Duganella sp. CF458]